MKRILLLLLTTYQKGISPFLRPSCRYYPSCSEYARNAVTVHGSFKGVLLAGWRLLRCNPWTKGGYDPVPPSSHLRRGQGA